MRVFRRCRLFRCTTTQQAVAPATHAPATTDPVSHRHVLNDIVRPERTPVHLRDFVYPCERACLARARTYERRLWRTLSTLYDDRVCYPDDLMDTPALFDPCALHSFVLAQHRALVKPVTAMATTSSDSRLSDAVNANAADANAANANATSRALVPLVCAGGVYVCNLYGAMLTHMPAVVMHPSDIVQDTLAQLLHDWTTTTSHRAHALFVVPTVLLQGEDDTRSPPPQPYLHTTWAQACYAAQQRRQHRTTPQTATVATTTSTSTAAATAAYPQLHLVVWSLHEQRHTVLPNYTRWLQRLPDPPVTFATMYRMMVSNHARGWVPYVSLCVPEVQRGLLFAIVQRAALHWRVVHLRANGKKHVQNWVRYHATALAYVHQRQHEKKHVWDDVDEDDESFVARRHDASLLRTGRIARAVTDVISPHYLYEVTPK